MLLRPVTLKSERQSRLSTKHSTTQQHNVEYIISAEFDNILGPIVKYQYPKTIPGFKFSSNGELSPDGPQNIASLMIPNNVEKVPGKSDFTTFILYHNKYTQNYQLFPPPTYSNKASEKSNVLATVERKRYSIVLEEEELESDLTKNKKDDLDTLFFFNVVNTKLDKTNDRGAIIRSLAIGTTLKNYIIFKPILTMTLDYYMSSPRGASLQTVIDLFNIINSVDLSIVTKFNSNVGMQRILGSITNQKMINRIFDPNENILKTILKLNDLKPIDSFGNKIIFHEQLISYYFTRFHPIALPTYFKKIPLQINLVKSDPIPIFTNYNSHILKFLEQFIPLLMKTDMTKNYSCLLYTSRCV